MVKKRKNAFAESILALLHDAQGKDIQVRTIVERLAKKGQAALLILFSLPFCQPIQIPGFSFPFGIALAFIGSRIAFGHRIWLPQRILDMKIPYHTFEKIARLAIKVTDKLLFFVSTRMVDLVKNPAGQVMHGLTIMVLALILALPLPIPLSNLLAAYPLLIFGLALLEDDGAAILVAYGLSLICFFAFALVIWVGKESLMAYF
ncbi:MAG: exopolysaccharide biosynthesis protein [Candidatus Protochlamydia sp.]|nr:exopolysaccharide biosynthesis protein [Candidatus Protochlamydia sp.]